MKKAPYIKLHPHGVYFTAVYKGGDMTLFSLRDTA